MYKNMIRKTNYKITDTKTCKIEKVDETTSTIYFIKTPFGFLSNYEKTCAVGQLGPEKWAKTERKS